MPLGISQLVAAVGDANIYVQNIAQNFVGGYADQKNATLTFAGPPDIIQSFVLARMSGQPARYTALVLWIPTDKIPKEMRTWLPIPGKFI